MNLFASSRKKFYWLFSHLCSLQTFYNCSTTQCLSADYIFEETGSWSKSDSFEILMVYHSMVSRPNRIHLSWSGSQEHTLLPMETSPQARSIIFFHLRLTCSAWNVTTWSTFIIRWKYFQDVFLKRECLVDEKHIG